MIVGLRSYYFQNKNLIHTTNNFCNLLKQEWDAKYHKINVTKP